VTKGNLPDFSTQCSHLTASYVPQKMVAPMVVVGYCNALHAGIGMTINLPGHPMSVTQQYFNNE